MVSDMLVGTSGKECTGISGAATGPGAELGVGELKVPNVGCSGEIALRRPLEP